MTNHNPPDQLWLMLGEIRGDLKWLVDERKTSNRRIDDIEAGIELQLDKHDDRITKLEGFATRIGVLTTALGVLVPTAITIVVSRLGLL